MCKQRKSYRLLQKRMESGVVGTRSKQHVPWLGIVDAGCGELAAVVLRNRPETRRTTGSSWQLKPKLAQSGSLLPGLQLLVTQEVLQGMRGARREAKVLSSAALGSRVCQPGRWRLVIAGGNLKRPLVCNAGSTQHSQEDELRPGLAPLCPAPHLHIRVRGQQRPGLLVGFLPCRQSQCPLV